MTATATQTVPAERIRPGRDYQTVTGEEVCGICGKSDGQPHTGTTRAVHADHMARLGWSGMCAAPSAR